jgi:hypothetical protein
MGSKFSAKRGLPVIAVIAALAALAGPGVASAKNGKTPPGQAKKAPAVPALQAPAVPALITGQGIVASWAEDASWAES